MIVVLLLLGSVVLLYFVAIKPYSYWKKRNVLTGSITPIFGDNLLVILNRESFVQLIQRLYNKVPDARYVGSYQFLSPLLVLKSPELIKQMCVKEFDHFLNHRPIVPDGVDELWSRNLFSLRGQRWKNMRSTLSPSFTGSKMKLMFVLICHNADIFVQHFQKKQEEIVELEFQDTLRKYTNDVIASSAFGIQVDSLGDPDNEFYLMGKEAGSFGNFRTKAVLFLYQLCPALAKSLRLKFFSEKLRSFFINLVKDTIKMREEQNIKRPDMLGLLMETRENQQMERKSEKTDNSSFAAVEEYLEGKEMGGSLTDMDIASQVFVFFLGGFESVSSAMCFMAYELAVNPDVQKKLVEEIDENRPKNGAPNYETIVNMTYMDMVISETLRKYPLVIGTDRVVTKPYTIQPELPGEQPVNLEVGTPIMIPIYAIHHDPQYYENPDKFDPERFSPENRKTINPYTYLPFGVGPRNCIGSRFALLEIKAIFFYLLSQFEIVPIEKTQIPLTISKFSFNLTSENGFPLGLKKRR